MMEVSVVQAVETRMLLLLCSIKVSFINFEKFERFREFLMKSSTPRGCVNSLLKKRLKDSNRCMKKYFLNIFIN